MPILQIINNPEKRLWKTLLERPVFHSEDLELERQENIG